MKRVRLRSASLVLLVAACTPASPAPMAAARSSEPPAASADAAPAVLATPAEPVDAGAADAGADAASEPPAAERPLDEKAVAALVKDAEASDSDGLVIVKDGKLVGEWYFGKPRGPIELMSITKSVIGLAIGTLVDAGKIRPETPIASLYPAWAKDERREITLEHLLTHSSGLEEGDTTLPIYRSDDYVRFTLRTKLVHPPGTHYEYSNRAANLLSGIVTKLSGMPTDRYVKKTLFEPMGIREFWWSKDKQKQPSGMAGLHLLPRDLAKIGELVLSGGEWNGQRLVSREWVTRSTTELAALQPANKRLGRLFWLIPEWSTRVIDAGVVDEWKKAGVSDAFIARVAPLENRRFASTRELTDALAAAFGDPKLTEWNETTWKRGLSDVRFEFGPLVGVYSAGTLGQYLVVLPRDRLVVVRMRRSPKHAKDREDPAKTFPDFVERVQGLLAR